MANEHEGVEALENILAAVQSTDPETLHRCIGLFQDVKETILDRGENQGLVPLLDGLDSLIVYLEIQHRHSLTRADC